MNLNELQKLKDRVRAKADEYCRALDLVAELMAADGEGVTRPATAEQPAARAARRKTARCEQGGVGSIIGAVRGVVGTLAEPFTLAALRAALPPGCKPAGSTISTCLHKLKERGDVEQAGRGLWRRTKSFESPKTGAATERYAAFRQEIGGAEGQE